MFKKLMDFGFIYLFIFIIYFYFLFWGWVGFLFVCFGSIHIEGLERRCALSSDMTSVSATALFHLEENVGATHE